MKKLLIRLNYSVANQKNIFVKTTMPKTVVDRLINGYDALIMGEISKIAITTD